MGTPDRPHPTELRRGRVTAGRDSLVALLPTLRPVMKARPLIPWEIANELASLTATVATIRTPICKAAC